MLDLRHTTLVMLQQWPVAHAGKHFGTSNVAENAIYNWLCDLFILKNFEWTWAERHTGRYACLQYPPRPLYDTLHRVANSCASPGERRSRDVQQCYKLTEYLTVRFDMGAFYLLAITIDAIDVIEFLMNSFLQLPPRVKSTLCDL